MADAPPQEVLVEFLRLLNAMVAQSDELLVPVLRGSTLLRHWFGERARQAGDIDLECFQRARPEPTPDERARSWNRGFGRWGEFESLVDFGKAMCRYAAESTQYRRSNPHPEVEFDEIEAPADGHSLWTYGTPGERYYTGWTWRGGGGMQGRLQIDLAESAAYALDDVDLADITLSAADGVEFRCPAYTPEMLLASKVSWLLRSLKWRFTDEHGGVGLEWSGEPKDLFDVHLLLTQAELREEAFQKSLLAVGAEDQLDWDSLEIFFDVRRKSLTDDDFSNWIEFRKRHAGLIDAGPVEILATVADRLEPLLGDFYLPEESPFLHAIHAEPANEFPYAIYADWLEERGDARCEFLRSFVRFAFAPDDMPAEEWLATREGLRNLQLKTSRSWLQRLFGTSAKYREFVQSLEPPAA